MPAWSLEHRYKLLLIVVSLNSNIATDWDVIARAMSTPDKTYTRESVRQAFAKIKKEADLTTILPEIETVSTRLEPATPTKAAPAPRGRKRKAAMNDTGDDEDYDSGNATTTTKGTPKGKAKAKAEALELKVETQI